MVIRGAGHPQPALLPWEGRRHRPDICFLWCGFWRVCAACGRQECGHGCERAPERDRESWAVCARVGEVCVRRTEPGHGATWCVGVHEPGSEYARCESRCYVRAPRGCVTCAHGYAHVHACARMCRTLERALHALGGVKLWVPV